MKKQNDDFDKEFERTRKMMWVFFVVNLLIGLGVLGFIGWVVFMLMRYFGVV